MIEKQLPMNEDQLNNIASKIKNECFTSFRSKILGDINNSKGQEYVEKMKKQFKVKHENIRKKNIQASKDTCIGVLDNAFV
jgi:hypothetical protein